MATGTTGPSASSSNSNTMDTADSTPPIETGKKVKVDKEYLGKVYATIKEGMAKASDGKINMRFDYNLEVVGSVVLTLLWKPSQTFTTKYHVVTEQDGVLRKTEWVPNWTTLKAWAEGTQKALDPKQLFPILFLIQMTVKAKEEIIYHKNQVSKELALPAWTEIYAEGKSIANKLKKSRNLSVGPLTHVLALKKMFNLSSQDKSKLNEAAVANIKKRHIDALKRQLISETQRSIVDEFASNNFENLPLLAASMASIKPHIEHHYALPPYIIFHIDCLKGANMTDNWVLIKIAEAVPKITKICPKDWKDPLDQILVHQVFGTWKENLAVIEWAFGRTFDERSKWGGPSQIKNLQTCVKSTYSFSCVNFSKPQKGAPRNIGPAQSQQLSNTVVMRGKRKVIDHFSDPEEIVKRMKPSGQNLMQRIQSEFKTYQALEKEGTGDWQSVNIDGTLGAVIECPVQQVKFFFGTPSASS
uniref:Nucleocapsid protein n=1 Tax=Hubei orthoptera virus 6 TaxID=1923014 RepID=A0A1L3KKH2_9VIRU|nr:nucleocapsid protein [Hubei orthoptera virus 6]